tara:strand:+ start:193 stop:483 length:291 start_codon:yes stop_codon:yes gene_type:complete
VIVSGEKRTDRQATGRCTSTEETTGDGREWKAEGQGRVRVEGGVGQSEVLEQEACRASGQRAGVREARGEKGDRGGKGEKSMWVMKPCKELGVARK